MLTEKVARECKFRSSPLAGVITRCVGLGLISVSVDFLNGWANPSWDRLPYMLLLLPFGLFLLAGGGALAIGTCDVEILDDQLRFRRLFNWRSVPLDSITRMRFVLGTAVVWVNYAANVTGLYLTLGILRCVCVGHP